MYTNINKGIKKKEVILANLIGLVKIVLLSNQKRATRD